MPKDLRRFLELLRSQPGELVEIDRPVCPQEFDVTALLKQLAPGGRLVMPVGDPKTHQELVLIRKDSQGRLASRELIPVRFVPLLRGVR